MKGMTKIAPIYRVIGKIGVIRNLSDKISVLKKINLWKECKNQGQLEKSCPLSIDISITVLYNDSITMLWR